MRNVPFDSLLGLILNPEDVGICSSEKSANFYWTAQ
jgi:hypothetical protein